MFDQNSRKSCSLVEGPQCSYSEKMFYAQNVKGKTSLLLRYKRQQAQLELGLEPLEQSVGSRPPRPGHSEPRSCWQLTLEPKSSLCSPTKAGRIAFICHIQAVDLSLCVYLLVSHLRKEISFLYSEFPGLASPRSST